MFPKCCSRCIPAPVGEGQGWGQCFFPHTNRLLYPFISLHNITDPTPYPSPTGAGSH